jgi:putative restriction endonuclease
MCVYDYPSHMTADKNSPIGWWVNQNQTHNLEVPGNFLWSPKTTKTGSKLMYYDNMTKIRPGDIVFSYYGQAIRAIGIASGVAYPMGRPSDDSKWNAWGTDGWMVEVSFTILETPIVPSQHPKELASLVNGVHAPLTEKFAGRQAYLFELGEERTFALRAVVQRANKDLSQLITFLSDIAVSEEKEPLPEAAMQPAGDTEAAVLVRARKGQGLFRARVANYSSKCRVTGVAEPSLLRASHIKPWSKCESNEERLDGANGLLLSPHVDLLFDKGLLTFRPTGQLEISEVLPKYVVEAWNITRAVDSTPFKPRQAEYLKFHNDVVYPLGKERWNRG